MILCRPPIIVPVLDIKGGEVVAAVGGNRHKYQPVGKPLFSSSNPVAVVERYKTLFNFSVFYVADLNAIMGNGDNLQSILRLLDISGCKFMIDGGYKKLSEAPNHKSATPVLATETFLEWDNRESLSDVVVSIDTKGKTLISPFPNATIDQILQKARSAGAKRFIHLRLDAVGAKIFSPEKLIRPKENEVWLAGGGVRSKNDLNTLAATGYSGALVATALYEGLLP